MTAKDIITFNPFKNKDNSFVVGLDEDILIATNIFSHDIKDVDKNNIVADRPARLTHAMMVYCTAGEIRFQVNLQDVCISAGDIFLFESNSIYRHISTSEDIKAVMLAFREDTPFFRSMDPDIAYYYRQLIVSHEVLHITSALSNIFLDTVKHMIDVLLDEQLHFKREAIDGYARVLIAHASQCALEKSQQAKNVENKDNGSRIFSKFIALISAAHGKERELSYYADKLCLTPKYLSQVVFKTTGKHAKLWIRDYVILEAQALLGRGDRNVQEVAEALGFPNSSFFGKYFKNATGKTPREYMTK